MYRFLHLLFGEYTVCLYCEDVLPFLRVLTANKVLFWSLRGGDGVWYLKTTLANAEPLLGCAQEYGIHGEIIRRKGLPFFVAKYKKRPGLLLGLLVGLALLFGLVLDMKHYGFWLGDAVAGFTPFFIGLGFYWSGSWKRGKAVAEETEN